MDGKTLGEMCKVRFEIPLGLKNTEMLMDYIQNNSSLEVSYTPSYHINYVQTLNGYARQRTGIALEGTITNPETHTFSEFNGVTCERDSKNKLHDTNRFSSIEFALTSELTDITRTPAARKTLELWKDVGDVVNNYFLEQYEKDRNGK